MMIDSYGCIRMEHCEFPGSIGDSCAETSRAMVLSFYLRGDVSSRGILLNFFTSRGLLRHPDSPWRENDTSSDQVLPLLVATHLTGLTAPIAPLLDTVSGNGDLVSPMLYACQRRFLGRSSWFYDLAILGHALITKLPFRWSDSRKTLESSSGSSCDYLNFTMCLIHAKATNTETWPIKMAKSVVSKATLTSKVIDYYAGEPNPFVLPWYIKALERLYK